MEKNLLPVRENPTEAMTTILRGEGWVHPEQGVGHDFVKVMAKEVKKRKMRLMDVCLEDPYFVDLYKKLPILKQNILQGHLEEYISSAKERARGNIVYAKEIIQIPN